MTNLEGAMPPPDRRYVEQSISLGRKILERERSLGMTPIQQGYSGHVPRLFRQKFPQARIRETGGWCGFPPTAQLDPLDPLFARFGLSLLKKAGGVYSVVGGISPATHSMKTARV